MSSPDYVIVPYRPEWRQQVAELMVHLWGADVEPNLAYLQWKHEANPYAPQPLALVTLHDGYVVGFRGYMAVPFWHADTGDELIILCAGDTCVHPDHRLRGLSVRMGKAAMGAYSDRYALFMNWTCTKPSLPGYRKMGFLPLVEKTYLTYASPVGSLRYLLAFRVARDVRRCRVPLGRTGDLLIATEPRPAEMAALAGAERTRPGTLALFREEAFLAWRFANPEGRYLFYYLFRDDAMAGYAAMGLSPNTQRGYLLDFAEAEPGALQQILETMVRLHHFDVLSVHEFGCDAEQRQVLERLGFSRTGLIPFLEAREKGRLPLLVRPVKEDFGEEDLWVQGVDVRRVESWSLRPIASDAG